MEEFKEDPEALNWLRSNPNQDSGFASNRFSLKQAIQFVEELYAGGATKVVIPKMATREEQVFGSDATTPYADSMVVFYEPDISTNEKMIRMCLQEIENEGFLMDENQHPVSIEETLPRSMSGDSFYLWWD